MDPTPPKSVADRALEQTLSYEEGRTPETPPSVSVSFTLAPGTSIHRYIILDRVGAGGMGVVYAAYDPSLDRRVALKFLASKVADRHGVREKRLLREAQAMARLSHPNVAVAFDVGTFQGHVFLAMEFVDGVDLRTWLAEKPRPFAQVLDVFRAAGRGLAAAHAAGIIHRDFKPANVLLDKHERPRVTDFGLSRATHEPEEEGEPSGDDRTAVQFSPSHLSLPLTRTGGVLGTPSYMPPEQRTGGPVDARSDQFSFCVALYQALYGEHPFPGGPVERTANAMAGRVAPAPAHSSVPKWCRQALLRGLAPEPAHRFSSMDGLLAALSPHPISRWRQVATAASLAVVLAAVSVYALFFNRAADSRGPSCDLGAQRLAGVWDDARRQQLRDAFLRSGARGADVTWINFSTILDHRASAWAAMHNQACAATHVDGSQSPAVLDLRMECLERKRQEMKALVEVYADAPDAKILDRAITAADNLSSLSACADVPNLRAVVPLPEDPAVRARVESLRERLSHSRALYEAGYEQPREDVERLRHEADAIGYPPLSAEAANALARQLNRLGQVEDAVKILFEAAKQAIKGRDWKLEAETWLELIAAYTRRVRVQEGLLAVRVAELAVERANGDELLRALLASSASVLEESAGNLDESLRQIKRAVELYKSSAGLPSPQVARTLDNVGLTLDNAGRSREALSYLEQALVLQKAVLRPDHPEIAVTLRQLSSACYNLGLLNRAREAAQDSLAIQEQELGPDHVSTSYSLMVLGQVEAALGNFDRAFQLFDRVLSIRKQVGEPSYVGSTYGAIGDAQMLAGRTTEAERNLELSIDSMRGQSSRNLTSGMSLAALGLLHNSRGLYRRALRECRLSLEIMSSKFGQESSRLVTSRECIGEALIGIGDFEAARSELELALTQTIVANLGTQWITGARFQLARALWATPAERPRARELARAALNELYAAEGDNRRLMARIGAWLEAHGASPTRENRTGTQ